MSSIEETEQETLLSTLDCLYCEEEKCWEELEDEEEEEEKSIISSKYDPSSSLEDELDYLLSKEEKIEFSEGELDHNKLSMAEARKEAVDWIMRVNAHHGFSSSTLVLSVNYFDRFMRSFDYQENLPWMSQLAAVACLSLASKWEGTHHVPLLLDFQVESKYIFGGKTVQRMELLVLSTLEWKMNAVTPFSYFGILIKRLNMKTYLHWEILSRCQSLIVSAVVDPRFSCYFPSGLAVATIVLALNELGLRTTLENQICLMDTFKLRKDKIEGCYKFVHELANNKRAHKRNCADVGCSPKNVLDVIFCERSIDSPSPERKTKRSRIFESHCLE